LQTDVEVVFSKRFVEPRATQRVSQSFCSAVSASYSKTKIDAWEPLAKLALDAAYEATLLAAVVSKSKNKRVWLTFLGGGAFGNKKEWICNAIGKAIAKCNKLPLDVRISHYKRLDKDAIKMIDQAHLRHLKG